ncbi:MAG: enoyl-CoA hydratase/isomerase family protein [Lentisphaeraceae bacterium]|nr:enoyl-CoA hydratase/isomerase family protein [Lentisphaeraceae bacterium]
MQKYKNIELQIPQPGVAAVILNRPEVHNAFNAEMILEITELFDNLSRGDEIRLICLKAQGNNFCTGADLQWMSDGCSYDEAHSDSLLLYNMFHTIVRTPHPVIASVQGAVYGGGLGLLSVCDYVQAAADSRFCFAEVKLGLLPATISPFIMRKIGYSMARAYMLSGREFKAKQALAMGLIHQIGDLEEDFSEVIGSFLVSAPKVSGTCKKMLADLEEGQSDERHFTAGHITRARLSKEGREGMSARLEKRNASWVQRCKSNES